MKVSPTTIVLGLVAGASVTLVYADPFGNSDGRGVFVSTKSAAQRLFPTLAEADSAHAEIIIAPTGSSVVRLVPRAGGHVVLVDDAVLGPVDPEALEGLWSSLRMATTLRAVAEDAQVDPVIAGELRIELSGQSIRLRVGGDAPEGSGLYATLVDDAGTRTRVIEREIGQILDQRPEAWLARRLMVVEPGEVTRILFDDAKVERGADGNFRSTAHDVTALLSTGAVEARISRVVSARLDPLLPPGQGPTEDQSPWMRIATAGDRRFTVWVGDVCPGHPERVMVARGEGVAGCVDAQALRPWPLPGREMDGALAWVEPRLLPHDYGRVLRIEQTQPERRTLQRHGGDWVIEESGTASLEVGGAEVFGWYKALHDAEVEALAATPDEAAPQGESDVDFVVHTDAMASLRLRCRTRGDPPWCRRDEGPPLVLRDPQLRIGFDRATFSTKDLFELQTSDVRGVEILPGPGSDAVRQSAHFDLGVWRLDAPEHPDPAEALSELALEDLLAAFAGARAVAWMPMPTEPPQRIVRVEVTPTRGRDTERVLRLHDDCIAVTEARAARVSESVCNKLQTDLLHDDPLRAWLDGARSVELAEAGETTRLRREDQRLVAVDGTEIPDAVQVRLSELNTRRASSLRSGEPSGPRIGTLRILPRSGPALRIDYGETWARLEGARWHFVMPPDARAPDPVDPL